MQRNPCVGVDKEDFCMRSFVTTSAPFSLGSGSIETTVHCILIIPVTKCNDIYIVRYSSNKNNQKHAKHFFFFFLDFFLLGKKVFLIY